MKVRIFALACAALLAGAASANAQQEVKVGVLYPLSGPTAQIGLDAVAAVRTAVDIVNQGADLPLALAKSKGLPGLGGAKITIVVVDHQGKPDVGQSETERLITQEKVHVVFGAYFSSVTATASQAAERAGIPFVNAESSQPALTERGLKYFFRTSPTDETFTKMMFDFLKDFGAKSGQKFQSASIFHEDTAGEGKQRQDPGKDHLQGADDLAHGGGSAAQGRQCRRAVPLLIHLGCLPLAPHRQGARLQSEDDPGTKRRLHRSDVPDHHGQGRRGRHHALAL
jgi:ABC-type sugar transport system substrate-binding protein